MTYLFRLGTSAFVIVAVLSSFLFLTAPSDGLEDILYEELTCEELVFSYNFNREVLDDMLVYHDGCIDFIDAELQGHSHGALECSFLREHGEFVRGIANDVASVFNIKCADG